MRRQLISSNTITTTPDYYPPAHHSNLYIDPADNNHQVDAKKDSEYFTSALAHEFRNPLTNIQLSVEMLKSVIEDDKMKVFLGIIMRSSARINDLIIELLKYERGEVRPEKCSARQLLD